MSKIDTTLEREIYGEGDQKAIKLDNGEEYRIRTMRFHGSFAIKLFKKIS